MTTIVINQGSDRTISVAFRNEAGNAVAINSESAVIFGASAEIENALTASQPGTVGIVTVEFSGVPVVRVGVYEFRVRAVTSAGKDVSSEAIKVHIA